VKLLKKREERSKSGTKKTKWDRWYYEHGQYRVGLQLISGVGRQLIPRVRRGEMVTQKHRRMERSTRMEVNTRIGQQTYLGQLNGQTSENPRIYLEES